MSDAYGMSRERVDLCGSWWVAWGETALSPSTVAEAEQNGLTFFGCVVPGCFELDLQALGKVPDPFFGMNPVVVNEYAQKQHVYYAKRFIVPEEWPAPAGEPAGWLPIINQADGLSASEPAGGLHAAPDRAPACDSALAPARRLSQNRADAFLVFEGLDCFADVFINGVRAASLDNMLVIHRIDAGAFLLPGENELFIHIRPAVEEALKFDYPQFLCAGKVNYESLYVRKAPHMYGWDIMPRFVSAGIFRPAYIEYRPRERIDEAYLKTLTVSADEKSALLSLHYKIKGSPGGKYRLELKMTCGDSVYSADITPFFAVGKAELSVEEPLLWQPKGRGDANLYDVEMRLYKTDGVAAPLDALRFRHGIRTVALERTSLTDSAGAGEFVFVVNGEKIFAKGTNWVPADAFHSHDRERIPRILELVNDLNCNMIRCWGGNIYEDDVFYDICDASGILVWQDFTMACAIYPQDAAFANKIASEAACQIKRLRSHACVALWSGDNECDESYVWNRAGADPNSNILTRKVLPEAVRLHDGTRPYIGSSPYYDVNAWGKNDIFLPEKHLWGPRDYFKSRFYTGSLCHFVSEIGYHACPAPESVAKFISADKMWPCENNEEWLLHCTSPVPDARLYDYRVKLMCDQILELFEYLPDNLGDFAFASQAMQAEAKKFFIEMFRMSKWRRTGILWWNVADGWPQFSDAVTDYYFNKKLAYAFIKKSQQDICVMLGEPDSWYQDVVVSNDTRRDIKIRCVIKDVDSGEILFEADAVAKADSSTIAGKIRYARNKRRFLVITWDGEARGDNHYLSGQPPFSLEAYRGWLTKAGLHTADWSGCK